MLIAQLTDLHIGAGRRLAYRKVDTAGAFEKAVAHVMAMVPRPDVVLFTGDIGDLGDQQEYALVAEILTKLTIPYFMVPGNHDR
ncbi:phosphodiesterase, partial [Pseudidiomarina aestuarii]